MRTTFEPLTRLRCLSCRREKWLRTPVSDRELSLIVQLHSQCVCGANADKIVDVQRLASA